MLLVPPPSTYTCSQRLRDSLRRVPEMSEAILPAPANNEASAGADGARAESDLARTEAGCDLTRAGQGQRE